jgi:acyl-CoA hydrolase
VQGALQQWLGELIEVETVRVERDDSTLTVTVQYFVRRNQERQIAQFTHGVS